MPNGGEGRRHLGCSLFAAGQLVNVGWGNDRHVALLTCCEDRIRFCIGFRSSRLQGGHRGGGSTVTVAWAWVRSRSPGMRCSSTVGAVFSPVSFTLPSPYTVKSALRTVSR